MRGDEYVEVNGYILPCEGPEECRWVEELKRIAGGKRGNCKRALQGLNLLRNHASDQTVYAFHREADERLAHAIKGGLCDDGDSA